ncbi:MAG: DUF971 domain-containing protein [Planctomycetota bacterium]
MDPNTPESIDLKKDQGLAVRWNDGTSSYFPIAYLRRMSPSADMKQLRADMDTNPLTVLPRGAGNNGITATDAELVGNYAIRILFSDGHKTGLYAWSYLREIDPDRTRLHDETRATENPSDRQSHPGHGNAGTDGA